MKNKNSSSIDVSIIIVSWNVKNFLLEAIDSIKKFTKGITYEIIVVDNDSKDGSVESIIKQFSDITVIANKDNKGFGTANNQGVQVAKGRYLFFLNPDTKFLYNILPKLINKHEEINAFLSGPEQLDGKGFIVSNVSKVHPFVSLFSIIENVIQFFVQRDNPIIFKKVLEVPVINAAAWLIKKKNFEKIGMFDENLFMYFEEFDICSRIKAIGGKVLLNRNEYLIHYKQQSAKQAGWFKKMKDSTEAMFRWFQSLNKNFKEN